MNTRKRICVGMAATWLGGWLAVSSGAAPPTPVRTPLLRAVDLNVGETQEVVLSNGQRAAVTLRSLVEKRDPMRNAVREAVAEVDVNGERASLVSANYRLPQEVGGVRIDCPVTKGYTTNSRSRAWGLDKDARLRLWPAGSPLVDPATFGYPVKQKWFASMTQMANEPTYVDGGEQPGSTSIYYHYGLDFGGAEGLVEVVAAAAGLVVSAGEQTLPGYEDTPVKPRYDVVYVLDDRGWYYRYSHLFAIDEAIRPGARVALGQQVGVLGKEGGSGGWSHLHFDITARQPSGLWGVHDAYAFVWEAYLRQYRPDVIAVARPHHFARTGDPVVLDASRSWSAAGGPLRFQWRLSDGSTAEGPRVTRAYSAPGQYSEIVKVTDRRGRFAYDFAVVLIADREDLSRTPPTIHAAYGPTFGIRPGQEIVFKTRSFRPPGGEVWDFGDGTPAVRVQSDGNVVKLAKDGYAVTRHRFARPGDYLVAVRRDAAGEPPATAHLHVRVEP